MIVPLPYVAVGAVVGACLGSFVVTAALRSTRAEQALVGRSRCDSCGVTLGFARTLPVVSYLGQGGACTTCGSRIDPLHLVGEIAGGMIVAAALLAAPIERAGLLAALGLMLLASALVDTRTQRLPDLLTLAVAVIGVLLAALRSPVDLLIGAVAAVLTFLVLEALRRGFLALTGKPGLGFGDVKLAAALALWLGLATPWAIAIASVMGLVAMTIKRPADGRLSFGPAIAMASFGVGLLREAGAWPQLS